MCFLWLERGYFLSLDMRLEGWQKRLVGVFYTPFVDWFSLDAIISTDGVLLMWDKNASGESRFCRGCFFCVRLVLKCGGTDLWRLTQFMVFYYLHIWHYWIFDNFEYKSLHCYHLFHCFIHFDGFYVFYIWYLYVVLLSRIWFILTSNLVWFVWQGKMVTMSLLQERTK